MGYQNHHLPKGKVSLKPKTHHGWTGLIFLCGFLFPPLAVAVRFGIGTDFFINLVLVFCGYFPSHGHNFYIQNIRNNTGKGRTPKWALKYGLVDRTEHDRKLAKSQWAKRYDERNPESTLAGADLAEGEEGDNYTPSAAIDPEEIERRKKAGLWTREEEEYYNEHQAAPNQRHWHYPANFEGAAAEDDSDRFERSRAARNDYSFPADSGSSSKKKSKKSKRSDIAAYAPQSNSHPMDSTYDDDVPEWGRDYGAPKSGRRVERSDSYGSSSYASNGRANGNGNGNGNGNALAVGAKNKQGQENWDHQF